MSCGGFWLDSKCIETLSKLGELIKKIRLAARLHPEKIEQYCRQLTELVRLAVEVEEMRENAPETVRKLNFAGDASLLLAAYASASEPREKVSKHG